MTLYSADIKRKTDAIAAGGVLLLHEGIIPYTLNGYPGDYQAFKTAIRTKLQQINLDDFYSLVCSEETNLATKTVKELQQLQITPTSIALAATR